ncbi:MAG: endonuclease/exonuclease/phosphatase family protein [Anaerolineae bacterium]
MALSTQRFKFLRLVVSVLSVYVLFASLGRLLWVSDLLAIYLDYVVVLLLIAVGFAIWRKLWPFAGIGLIFCVWGAINIFSFTSAPLSADQPANLRLMVYNVYYNNQDVEAVQAEIKRLNPDLLYLMEYPSEANRVMRLDLDADYPYQFIEPSRRTMGTAFYSKYPITSETLHRFQETRIPIFEIELMVNGETVVFVGGHPWPPLPQWGETHREQLADIIDVATAVRLERPTVSLIVGGDFNTPPTAYMLDLLTEQADVAQVRNRFDYRKTFFSPSVMGTPIDHVFVSDQLTVADYSFGELAGSDHRPLVVDFSMQVSE